MNDAPWIDNYDYYRNAYYGIGEEEEEEEGFFTSKWEDDEFEYLRDERVHGRN